MNMLGLPWRELPELVQQDIERVTGLSFPECLMWDLDGVIRAMEDAPGAFGPALVLLQDYRASASAAPGPGRWGGPRQTA